MLYSPSSEANISSTRQKIHDILQNYEVHHRTHNSLPTIPLPGQLIQSTSPHPFRQDSFLILSHHLRLRPQSSTTSILADRCHKTQPSHPRRFSHPTIQIMKIRIMHSLHPPASFSLPGTNIFLSTPFSNTLIPCSSLTITDQVSYPYKSARKVIVLGILIFTLLDGNRKDKKTSSFKHADCSNWRDN